MLSEKTQATVKSNLFGQKIRTESSVITNTVDNTNSAGITKDKILMLAADRLAELDDFNSASAGLVVPAHLATADPHNTSLQPKPRLF